MEEPQLINFLKSEGESIVDLQEQSPSVHFCTGLAEEISQDGSHRLVAQYGSLLRIFTSLGSNDSGIVKAALQCLDDAIKKLGKEFREDGGNIRELAREKKQYLRKSLVVAIFLIFKSFHELEAQVHNDKQNQTITDASQVLKRRGKKKAVQPAQPGDRGRYGFWNALRAKITSSFKTVLSCPWEHLWPEGNNAFKYMRCLTIAYCDVLKKGGEDLQLGVDESDDIFYILGILSSRADEEKSIVGRLIPLVKTSEEMAKLLCQCFSYIEENFEKGTIVESAVIEASNVYFAQLQTETAIERGFAVFITDLAISNPQQLIKCLPSFITFLEAESSTVRSAVLVAGADILAWHKKKPEEEHAIGTDNRIKSVLSVLLNHTKDVNALVRSKALQMINKLISNKDIDGPDLVPCMEVGAKRLLDKGTTVRKQAIQLMVTIVTKHPLMVKFTNMAFREEIRKSRILVHEMLAKDAESKYQILEIVVGEFTDDLDMPDYILDRLKNIIKDSNEGMKMIETALQNGNYWEACELFYVVQKEFSPIPHIQSMDGKLEKQLYMKYLTKGLEELFPGEQPMDLDSSQNFENIASSEQVLKKKAYIEYLKHLEEMSMMMGHVQQIMTVILDKGAPGDKEEVINFFSEIATIGFKPSKALTISVVEALAQCKEIDDGILTRFCRLFLDDPSVGDEARGTRSSLMLVRKLIEIVDLLSYAQRDNIIPLLLLLRKKQIFDNSCIQLLWDAFTLATPGWENKDSSSAVYLLGVLGQAENSIVTTNIKQLVSIGLGDRGLEDFNLVKSSLESLIFVCKKPKQIDEESADTMRFPASEDMFDKIIAVIGRGLKEKGNRIMDENFCAVAELAIQLIYRLCIDPKTVIEKLLEHLHDWVFGDGENASQIKNTERLVTRYLGVCTALLGCELLFLETTVSNEVKRRRTLILKKDEKSSKGKKGKKTSSLSKSTVNDSNANNSTSSLTNKSASINESAVETNELDQITGANGNFENDSDVIKKYTMGMLDNGIHRQFRVHALLYCNKINCYKSLRLKLALIKALAKIMSVSESAVLACTENFNALWDKVNHPMVKVEILRAAILLNQRFPNQMEKCTKCVTQGLRDKNPAVKKAALDFITYLTLNDLLKVRGQLTQAALLVCDEDLDVREMARDFLKQCAEKDNVLMNAIPDIISRLNRDVDQETFRSILKYLLAQIKKDKQTTGMVEKLLSRFTLIEESGNVLKMHQNTAFCITQFPVNEKSLKVVIERLTSYSDKLDDDLIYECFVDIIKEARKTCKAEARAKIDEFEKDIQEAREKCVEMKRMEDAAAGRGPPESEREETEGDSQESEREETDVDSSMEADEESQESREKCVKTKCKKDTVAGRGPQKTEGDSQESEREETDVDSSMEADNETQEAREKCVKMKRKEDTAAGRGPQETEGDSPESEREDSMEADNETQEAREKCVKMKRKEDTVAGRGSQETEGDSPESEREEKETEGDSSMEADNESQTVKKSTTKE